MRRKDAHYPVVSSGEEYASIRDDNDTTQIIFQKDVLTCDTMRTNSIMGTSLSSSLLRMAK